MRAWIAVAGLLALTAAPVFAETPAVLELTVGRKTHTGRQLARTQDEIYLQSADGQLRVIEKRLVTKERAATKPFKAWSSTSMRTAVLRELGSEFSSAATRRYAVFANSSQVAQKYAAIFEETYRSVYQYFSIRGVKLKEPEFPLVAIVFPDRAAFTKYAGGDKIKLSRSLMGYYHTLTNRVVLFENDGEAGEVALGDEGFSWQSIDGNLKDTIVHEATHQVAFNIGLHDRLGSNPKWAVEGLATVFETAAIRNTSSTASRRINPERFVWFGNYSKERRKAKSLTAFLSTDELFETDALDAYSEAWAFSFYLIETRPRQYVKYLTTIAARDPLQACSAEDRLADFRAAFGKNTALLEAQFLRYISQLKK